LQPPPVAVPWLRCRGLVHKLLRVFGPAWRGIVGDDLTLRPQPESRYHNTADPASALAIWTRLEPPGAGRIVVPASPVCVTGVEATCFRVFR
jgi:hypothetical protein